MSQSSTVQLTAQRTWQPLSPIERRVLGVLIEKAKTTPDAYPLSLNAIRTGCNQKSNRSPMMDVDEDAVREAIDGLREKGAVIEVQGGGRVPRFRHLGYEWLGVDKREIAIMTELLLRGPQTVGELRGHASRMEEIADLAALQPLLDSLQGKQLLLALTPAGRGQVVSHTLYPSEELKRIQRDHDTAGAAATGDTAADHSRAISPTPATPRPSATVTREVPTRDRPSPSPATAASPAAAPAQAEATQVVHLRAEIADAKAQIVQLRQEIDSVRDALRQHLDEFSRFRQELGG